MKYLSVCSGIEAATVAWHPLGLSPVAFSEIEKKPSSILEHHYPHVPNLGDMTRFKDWPDAAINVLVGGTPCQSFSVAGLRKGLDDPRGNLCLTYLAIADRFKPAWVLWENVPGVLSSNGGRDFGAFLGGLVQLGYGFAYRVLDAQYVRVDGFARAVPQRRRRVFVVGHLGDWRRAAAVLFERESLLWDSPPRRQAGQGVAPTISSRPTGGGGLGTDFDCDGGLVSDTVRSHPRPGSNSLGLMVAFGGNNTSGPVNVSTALQAHAGPAGRMDFASETFLVAPDAAATLTRGAESAGKGGYAGRRQEDDHNLVAWSITPSQSNKDYNARKAGKAQAITGNGNRPSARGGDVATVAYGLRRDADRSGEAVTPSPDAQGRMRLRDAGFNAYEELAPTLDTVGPHTVATSYAVRRLTPEECEALQGFPRGYTAIPGMADGPRYKALGNSMAVNVMRWLGGRIAMASALSSPHGNAP